MRILLLTMALVLPLAASAEESSSSLGTPVSPDTLAALRGGDEEIVHNTIHVNGDVTDNSATNVVTGANSIQDGSFANASGVLSVVQNTGANVLIQTATIVNVQFSNP
jgi:hypothetical protein